MTFTGIPEAAGDFYAGLEANNSKEYWHAHKESYERDVLAPMQALMAELEAEFGAAKIFRPHRDVRFSADKSPYKLHQGAYVPTAQATGWYVQVSADGLMIGGGCYHWDRDRLKSFRRSVDGAAGLELAQIVAELEAGGWEFNEPTVATAPRGFDRGHPRIELLRRTSLTTGRDVEDVGVITSARLAGEVRERWRELSALITWLNRL